MSFIFIPDVTQSLEFSTENPLPKSLYSQGKVRVLGLGLEAGQEIPVHPEGVTLYFIMAGKGWMEVNGERLAVKQGSVVITPAGAHRGINATSRMSLLVIRIFTNPKDTGIQGKALD